MTREQEASERECLQLDNLCPQCFFKDGHDPRIGVLSEIAEAVGKVTHSRGKFTTTGKYTHTC